MSSVILGDCVDVMATMDADSFDAIVTDPPYGLEFMGKEWDRIGDVRQPDDPTFHKSGSGPHDRATVRYGYGVPPHAMQVWHEAWARAAYRVAKPGAHLLAFGGTRTYHRLTCALEDAGWEIRDCLVWAYASGFPKSLDVSKAIDKSDAGDERIRRARRSQEWFRERLTPQQVNDATGTAMGHHLTTHPTQPFVPTPAMLDQLRPLIEPPPDWLEELVRERAVESANFAARPVVGRRSGSTAPGVAGEIHRGGIPTEWDETIAHTDAAKRWQGWGTALKPAWEPIVLARKPLAGTVAANVQRYGTGALNIDATRIPGAVPSTVQGGRRIVGGLLNAIGEVRNEQFDGHTNGRWPPNLLLTDAELFDVRNDGVVGSGARVDGGTLRDAMTPTEHDAPAKFGYSPDRHQFAYGDQGGYSRFFLVPHQPEGPSRQSPNGGSETPGDESRQAQTTNGHVPSADYPRVFLVPKASRSDREPVWGEELGNGVWSDGRDTPADYPSQRGKTVRRNTHPTTKPVDLMRHLVRLVTPPGGRILDPFLGSGTTAIAAIMEGFECVGIEREPEYVAIAEARLNGVQQGIGL